jgi:resuscitation-promoting factor RpfA
MEKSPDAFRTISEVAEVLDTPAHVLRFWESRFPQIKPVKRAGGRRYYRPSDIALLEGIKRLLHSEGMTIRGVQKVLREQGVRHVAGLSEEPSEEQVALEVALADLDHDTPASLTPPAAEDATVTVLQEAIARLRDGLPPPAPPVQQSLWETASPSASATAPVPLSAGAETQMATVAQPPLPPARPVDRPAEATEVPKGPTLAARLRQHGAKGDAAALAPLLARLTALRDRMSDTGHPGGL